MYNVNEGDTLELTDSTKRINSLLAQQHVRRQSLAKFFHHIQRMRKFITRPGYPESLHQKPSLSSRQRYVVHCACALSQLPELEEGILHSTGRKK